MWLVEVGPLGFVIARTITAGGAEWQLYAALCGAIALSLGGLLAGYTSRIGRGLVTVGVVTLLASLGWNIAPRPLLGLVLLLLAIGFIASVWSPQTLVDLVGRAARQRRAAILDVRLAAVIALVTWLVGVGSTTGAEIDPWIATASALASVMAIERAALWMRGVAGAVWTGIIVGAVLAAVAAAVIGSVALALSILALAPVGTLVLARAGGVQTLDTSWAGLIVDHPARLIVATFLVLCALGAILLSLPVFAAGEPIGRMDAAFTAVSAVCVTGLITLDTPNAFNVPGQAVILVLFQLGGLGIMTLSTAALGALGRRLSVRHEEAVAGLFSGEHRGLLFVALRRTIAVTFAIELAGAIVLAIAFWADGDSFGMGLWRAVFTAVSAFCNAGFALQTDSLIGFQSSPVVLNTVAVLIIAGGLSPAAIVALPRVANRRPVSLQVKVVLASTVALLALGTVAFAALEWNHSLDGLSIGDRLQNAWFQSVTLRTAGFNSVDFAALRDATLPLACAMMFVGGAPGGTAGGIKVTTMWIFFAAVAAALRGESSASSFGRRIPHTAVYRAIAIITISGGMLALVLMGVFLTQDMRGVLAIFEVFSAIGTVGLSMGGTAELDGLGKVMIMIAMFLGRVGPLTVFLFLVERRGQPPVDQLEENLEVG